MSDDFDYSPVPPKARRTLECLPEGESGQLRAEIERLQKHKRKQAEDIMTLGQMVGSLEAESARLRAEREQWHREAEMWHREYLRRAILGNRQEQATS